MSKFNKKGFKAIQSVAPSGERFILPVQVGSPVDQRRERMIKKLRKDRAKVIKDNKKKLREFKKQFPPEIRARIKWSDYIDKTEKVANEA